MTPSTPSQSLRYASDPSPEQAGDEVRLNLGPIDSSGSFETRCQQTLLLAEKAFSQTGSWVIFFREMFGSKGAIRALFPTPEEREKYEKTPEYCQVQEVLAAIRSQDSSKGDANEPERMITIRLPKSLHEALAAESEDVNLSINKLCITKLIQAVDSRYVPVQKGRRRGRRPGPQGPRIISDKVMVEASESADQNPSSNGQQPPSSQVREPLPPQ